MPDAEKLVTLANLTSEIEVVVFHNACTEEVEELWGTAVAADALAGATRAANVIVNTSDARVDSARRVPRPRGAPLLSESDSRHLPPPGGAKVIVRIN